MQSLTHALQLIIAVKKADTMLSRHFDSRLGGLGFNEFIILSHLSQAPEKKLKRIELARLMGLTPAAVTRILLPMEKVGLVKKDVHPDDARVSYVLLASGGKTRLQDSLERAEYLAKELLEAVPENELQQLADIAEKMTAPLA